MKATDEQIRSLTAELIRGGNILAAQAPQVRKMADAMGIDSTRAFFAHNDVNRTPEGAHQKLEQLITAHAEKNGVPRSEARSRVYSAEPELTKLASRLSEDTPPHWGPEYPRSYYSDPNGPTPGESTTRKPYYYDDSNLLKGSLH